MDFQSGAVRPVDSISQGWNMIKDNYFMYVLMMLLIFVVLIVASIVLGLINNGITFAISAAVGATSSGTPGELSAVSLLPQLISLIISFFTNIIVVTISGALFCGLYTALARTSTTGQVEFSDLFAGFSKIQACLIVAAIMSVIQFVIGIVQLGAFAALGISAVGLGGLMGSDGQPNIGAMSGLFGGMFLILGIGLVIQLIVSALTAFVYPLISDRDLSGVQAFTLSVRSGLANIGGLVLLLILIVLMMIGGALACLIGMLFVAPIVSAAIYSAFLSVFGRRGGSQNYNPPPPPNFGQQY